MSAALKRFVRRISVWAWSDELSRLNDEIDRADRHVKSMQAFMRDSSSEVHNLNVEIDRLRRLLRQTRMTFRRLKGRSGGVDINWPHPPSMGPNGGGIPFEQRPGLVFACSVSAQGQNAK